MTPGGFRDGQVIDAGEETRFPGPRVVTGLTEDPFHSATRGAGLSPYCVLDTESREVTRETQPLTSARRGLEGTSRHADRETEACTRGGPLTLGPHTPCLTSLAFCFCDSHPVGTGMSLPKHGSPSGWEPAPLCFPGGCGKEGVGTRSSSLHPGKSPSPQARQLTVSLINQSFALPRASGPVGVRWLPSGWPTARQPLGHAV